MRRFLLTLLALSCLAVGGDALADGSWTAWVSCSTLAAHQLPSYAGANYDHKALVQWQAQNGGLHAVYLGTSSSLTAGGTLTNGSEQQLVGSNGGLFTVTQIPGMGSLQPANWWCITVSGTSVMGIGGTLQ
jgi:hypothetical protein